jgi:hypothetical protein
MDKYYNQQLVQTPINLNEERDLESEAEAIEEAAIAVAEAAKAEAEAEERMAYKYSPFRLISKYSKQLDMLINIVLVLLLLVLVLQLVNGKKCFNVLKLKNMFKVKK